jgi:hypothetical protein
MRNHGLDNAGTLWPKGSPLFSIGEREIYQVSTARMLRFAGAPSDEQQLACGAQCF